MTAYLCRLKLYFGSNQESCLTKDNANMTSTKEAFHNMSNLCTRESYSHVETSAKVRSGPQYGGPI